MFAEYTDFELIVNEGSGGYTVEARGPQQISIEPMPLPIDLLSTLTEREFAQALVQLQRGYAPSVGQMQKIGALLFDALMPPPIRSAYARTQSGLETRTSLRLRLNIRPAQLAGLPWELLFDHSQNHFLATRRTQPIVRFLDSAHPVAQLRIDGPLSVLLLQAQPIGLAPLSLEKSAKALEETLGRRADIYVLANATPAKLRETLQKKKFHILHYDGHGFFDQVERRGVLALENEQKRVHPISGEQLANYLSGTQIRLVVLSACQSAQDSMQQRFVGVAQHLMRSSHLPAVVAMQFAIPDHSAIAFNRGFYGALANGFPVDAALADGRMAIQEVTGARSPDWATPLILMRSEKGRLWQHMIDNEAVTPLLTTRDPYVGLYTFQENDAEWFFGREGLVELLQEKVEEFSFLAILGSSGSGKSSTVLAGLLPALKKGALPNSEQWHYVTIKPTARPLDSLAAALNQVQGGNLGTLSTLRQVLASDGRGLLLAADMLRANDPTARLVLVVDQFEELWTLAPTEKEARQRFAQEKQRPFVRLLLSVIEAQKKEPDPSLLIILTMRIDFLHRAAENRDFARYLSDHLVIVSPMKPYELRKVIEEPAKKAGGTFEPGLADKLIKDTQDNPGGLPLLEYTLFELWKAKQADGTMTWHAFNVLGGVEGALAARADAILNKHYNSTEKQSQLRQLLLRLVQPGEGTADTRRRMLLDELVPAGAKLEGVQSFLKPLVDERLLTTSYDKTSPQQAIGEKTIEVSHEALIKAWPMFKNWIDEARHDLRIQLQLEEAAKEWQANDQNSDYLWSGLRLGNAEIWFNRAQHSLNERDLRFLQASRVAEQARRAAEQAAQQRELKLEQRARRLLQVISLIMTVVILSLLGTLAYVFIPPKYNRRAARNSVELRSVPDSEIQFEQYEVTNERYQRCVEVGRCSKPLASISTYHLAEHDNFPITGIDAHQAYLFCEWIGRRLPTYDEWKMAVTEGRPMTRIPTDYNIEHGEQEPDSVGANRATSTGIYDLIGNVWEWTTTIETYETLDNQKREEWDGNPATLNNHLIFVGGSYNTGYSAFEETDIIQDSALVDYRDNTTGFRCVEE